MLDNLIANFNDKSLHKLAFVCTIATNVAQSLQQEFKEDKETRDQAVDCLIELLKKQKAV